MFKKRKKTEYGACGDCFMPLYSNQCCGECQMEQEWTFKQYLTAIILFGWFLLTASMIIELLWRK